MRKRGIHLADSFLIPKYTFKFKITKPCGMLVVSISLLQSSIGQCSVCSGLIGSSRTLRVTLACASSKKFSKPLPRPPCHKHLWNRKPIRETKAFRVNLPNQRRFYCRNKTNSTSPARFGNTKLRNKSILELWAIVIPKKYYWPLRPLADKPSQQILNMLRSAKDSQDIYS